MNKEEGSNKLFRRDGILCRAAVGVVLGNNEVVDNQVGAIQLLPFACAMVDREDGAIVILPQECIVEHDGAVDSDTASKLAPVHQIVRGGGLNLMDKRQ